MRSGIFLFFLLLVPRLGLAAFWDRGAVLPHCQFLNIKVPGECRSELPPDSLAAILPLADRMVKDEQVRKLKDYVRGRMLEEIDTAIDSRKILLDCMSNLANATCAARVRTLKQALEQNLQRLRFALALSQFRPDPLDRSINPMVDRKSTRLNSSH